MRALGRVFGAASTLILFATLATTCSAWFFLPGITPNDYSSGEQMLVLANKLTSEQSRIPHDYQRMPFCAPDPSAERIAAAQTVRTSLAQLLQGERARLTAYEIHMLRDEKCKLACVSHFPARDVELLSNRIMNAYRVRLALDEMPVVEPSDSKQFVLGTPLGRSSPVGTAGSPPVVVYNHLRFTVRYHAPDRLLPTMRGANLTEGERFRVVGFEVEPASHAQSDCTSPDPLTLPATPVDANIPFTYSVRFVHSDVQWWTRFDTLIRVSPGRAKIQWFAVINSLMLALFLSATLAAVLLRTLRRDCARYGISADALGTDFDDDFETDAGWRILRGDVFRPPSSAGLLCVLCGSGTQLVLVAFVTLAFALLGVLSPRRRGSLLIGCLALWVLSAGVAGYVAARLHKAMGGTRWRRVTLGVAFMLPSVAFGIFTFLNLVMWGAGSIGATPIVAMLLLLFLWFGVSVPLAFAGTYFGYRHKAYNFAVRTNQIPRPIPTQPWFLRAPSVYALSGLVPFGVVCIELRLILHSIWQNEFYHMFAFLFSVFVILAITCAEVSVVLVFLKLSNSDYMWWWDSWMACASSGVYVFLYSLYYLRGQDGGAGSLPAQFLFVSYSLLGSLMFSLLTGSIGFLSSLAFTRRIYSVSVYD